MKEKILKPLGKIFTVLKVVCVILLILLVGVLALQRFSNNEVAIGGFRVFNVATGSMIPKYKVGDVLIVKETNIDKLAVGDDITYLGKEDSFANRVVTHQIIKIDETEKGKIFHTKGIANDTEDPEITGDQIYGKVIYKCVFISLLTKLMNNMAAFYVVFIIPFAVLIFLRIKDFVDERKENEIEDDEDEEYEEDDDEYDDEEDDEEDDEDYEDVDDEDEE